MERHRSMCSCPNRRTSVSFSRDDRILQYSEEFRRRQKHSVPLRAENSVSQTLNGRLTVILVCFCPRYSLKMANES